MSSEVEIGSEWAYRARDEGPSERVRVVEIHPQKQGQRVVVAFLDRPDAPGPENVPGRRLKVPWSEVKTFDRSEANWRRLATYELTEAQEEASETVFRLLIPTSVATWGRGAGYRMCAVSDTAALQALTGLSLADLQHGADWFEEDGELILSGAGTILIAEHACRRKPDAVIAWVLAEEQATIRRCKRWPSGADRQGAAVTNPDFEYEYYLEHGRVTHELLWQWCGHRAIQQYERLAAAEAEVHRLDVLLARALDALAQAGGEVLSGPLEREHDSGRITPGSVRPAVSPPHASDGVSPPA